MKLRALALAVVLLGGCDNSTPEPAAKAPEAPAPAPAEKAPELKLSAKDLAAADRVALVPSPAEMERSLAHAGVERKLASMVADRTISMDVENKDQVAVRAGVVLADLVLTVKESKKETTLARLDTLKVALAKLGAGSDVPAEIDSLKSSIENGELTGEDLVQEFDELSQVMVPEPSTKPAWVVPLIEAGSGSKVPTS